MHKSEKHLPVSFSADIDSQGRIIIPSEKYALVDKSLRNFRITITPEPEDVINSKKISRNDIDAICANQGIPLEVAIEFYECKGSLSDKSFLTRIESYDG